MDEEERIRQYLMIDEVLRWEKKDIIGMRIVFCQIKLSEN